MPNPSHEVGDQAARGREAHAELDDGVAEQRGDDPGEQERQPDGGAGDRARLPEQREDAGADHRADAEEGGAADAHVERTIIVIEPSSADPLPYKSDSDGASLRERRRTGARGFVRGGSSHVREASPVRRGGFEESSVAGARARRNQRDDLLAGLLNAQLGNDDAAIRYSRRLCGPTSCCPTS